MANHPRLTLAASALALLLWPASLAAQAAGAISGRVTDATTGAPVAGATVLLEDGRRGAITDSAGAYRIREVRAGNYVLLARALGFGPVRREGVAVQAGSTTISDFALQPRAVQLEDVVVESADPVLDPLATATEQVITADDFRRLPVSSLEEALALSAGTVGESYRGGRLGQESFIFDGLGVKNQLDASTGALGLSIPPDMLTEASLVTNGFSARYGQAVSGLINVVTKDGGDSWSGRLAYETDRPFGNGWDYGLDRTVFEADGPIAGGIKAVAALDLSARLDADPVNAPAPTQELDPRFEQPWMLPHNSGEQYNFAGKLTIPFGNNQTLRLFGIRSIDQRLLYDPAFKYDSDFGPARRTAGTLASAHLQHASGPGASLPLVADLRVALFHRDFVRGTLVEQPDYKFGAFTGSRFEIVGEDLARAQDTETAAAPLAGLTVPEFTARSPWGVPAFFLGGGSRGELSWNRFRELRTQLDLTFPAGTGGDLYVGGEVVSQDVKTFQRALGFLPVGDSVPAATASNFTPLAMAAYVEGQFRVEELGFTAGLRMDRFDPRADIEDEDAGARTRLNPRFAASTMLGGATFVASIGRFSQPPDYQYLVDAAFDDTLRTGRFRRGNPNLGFEDSWQYEFSVRARPRPGLALRTGVYLKRLQGLVATVPLGANPDSSIFGNADFGTVKGFEIQLEREMRDGWGVRASYTLQQATASSSNAFLLRRAIRIDTLTGDTIIPPRIEFPLDFDRRHGLVVILQGQVPDSAGPQVAGIRPFAGFEAALIARVSSGLPFTRRAPGIDTLIGDINGARLPSSNTFDLLLRRPVSFGRIDAGFYLDARNLLGRRNVVAVRRDSGTPETPEDILEAMAEDAYAANSQAIPYESPRYRRWADTNQDGYVAGEEELLPLYEMAARDFTQPLFAYGEPRLVRVGVELRF